MLSQEQTVQKDQTLSLSQQYTDKQVTLLRATLYNNINSVDVIAKKIKELEDSMRVLKLEQEVLVSENKQLKQDIHVIKVNAQSKQSYLEGY